MNYHRSGKLLLLVFFLFGPLFAAPDKSPTSDQDSSADASSPGISPTPTVRPNNPLKNQQPGKILFIHKPMPNPAWGKVIQYHRDQILALSEKNRETIHEFLFQDDAGIIRTAAYHENSSGDGYWEVWIWDQP